MRELFVIDKKNYIENGTVGRRPSVRGIVIKDGNVAMMHSLKYDYYKLPGGGIENGETYEETLVREVREESGLVVIKESIKEFGYVRRIEKGKIEDIFVQENFYFLCDVEEKNVGQELDDYEEDEIFTLEFVSPDHAIYVNENADHKEKVEQQTFSGMILRENRVLEIVKAEILSRSK
ncbi:MAG: NUDIX domain-containing protein [Lachnospiraceae bacterium]|nr:NUDIX domain-containing protein [Lachnospiraceae bacterium]